MIKSYVYLYDCVGRIDNDYADNIIVRMYFGKVCDGTLTEQQFMQRLHELWAVNPQYKLIKAKSIGDSSKISTVMDVRDKRATINIPGNWPDSPSCSIKANSKCKSFGQCVRYNDIVAQNHVGISAPQNVGVGAIENNNVGLSGTTQNNNVGLSGPVEHIFGMGSSDLGIGDVTNNNIQQGATSTDLSNQAKDIPWGWIALGGLGFVGAVIMIAAIKSKNESDYGSSDSLGGKNLNEPNIVSKIRLIASSSAKDRFLNSSKEIVEKELIDKTSWRQSIGNVERGIGRKLTDYEQNIFIESYNKKWEEMYARESV